MKIEEAIQNIKKWLACINRDDLDCLRMCDSCQNHVEAVTLYESLTVIVADAEKKTDEDKQLTKWLKELQERRKQSEIVHCGECRFNVSSHKCLHPENEARWLINSDGYYPYCSACMTEPQNGEMTDYCPNCGAKMKK